jgi:hypothetical protein
MTRKSEGNCRANTADETKQEVQMVGDLPLGATFIWDDDELMRLSPAATQELYNANLINALIPRLRDNWPIDVVRLSSRRAICMKADANVKLVTDLEQLDSGLIAHEFRECLLRNDFLLGGKGAATGRHQAEKSNQAQQAKDGGTEALYQDRLKAARAMPDCVPIKETKEEDPVTAGDRRVDQARKNSIQSVDASLAALQKSYAMFRKLGVDAELEEALKTGLKSMEPYLKIRKRRDMLRRTERTERRGMMAKCVRCEVLTGVTIMSYFNEDIICMECDTKERAHPKFKEAQTEEERHVRAGNYNFKGVGRPKDL